MTNKPVVNEESLSEKLIKIVSELYTQGYVDGRQEIGIKPKKFHQAHDQIIELFRKDKLFLKSLQIINADDFEYETEYDGRMYSICMLCKKQDGKHSKDCIKTKLQQAITEAEKKIGGI